MERIGSALLSRFSSLLNLATASSLTGIGSVADYISLWFVKIPTKGSGDFVSSCEDSVTVSIGGHAPSTLAITECTACMACTEFTASPEKASEELPENGSSIGDVTEVTQAAEVTSAGAETGGIFVCRSCNFRIPRNANVYFRMDMCFCSQECRFMDVA